MVRLASSILHAARSKLQAVLLQAARSKLQAMLPKLPKLQAKLQAARSKLVECQLLVLLVSSSS